MMHKRPRKPKKLPLPTAFRLDHREHWLDKHEREHEEHQTELAQRREASLVHKGEGRSTDIVGSKKYHTL